MGYMTLGELYSSIKSELNANEAAALIGHFIGASRADIAVNPLKPVAEKQRADIQNAVRRRKKGEPLQYIIGCWEFYGGEFFVGEGVLIPRQDTETLCDQALDILPHGAKVLDLCAGSGCIAVTLKAEREDLTVYAVEKYPAAFGYLKKNISHNRVDVKAFGADALYPENLPDDFYDFDMIVSNPPYLTADDMKSLQTEVEFEPETALYGGDNGLYFYEQLTRIWKGRLKSGGVLMYEIGAGQENAVESILKQNRFENGCHKRDICGIIRVVYGVKK